MVAAGPQTVVFTFRLKRQPETARAREKTDMDLTSPEKRRVQSARRPAVAAAAPRDRGRRRGNNEARPARPPRRAPTGLNFKKAVRGDTAELRAGLVVYSLTRVDEDDDQTYAVLS